MKTRKASHHYLGYLIFFSSFIFTACLPGATVLNEDHINSFDDCLVAGNPAMESYPRQCRTKGGKHFVEDVSDDVNNGEVFCIEQYDPVCGQIDVQCIKAPCPPLWQTFSNDCFANVAQARNIQKGSCENLNL